jgi:hypothetical protein
VFPGDFFLVTTIFPKSRIKMSEWERIPCVIIVVEPAKTFFFLRTICPNTWKRGIRLSYRAFGSPDIATLTVLAGLILQQQGCGYRSEHRPAGV